MTMDGKRVSSEVIRGTMAFFICYAAIAVVSIPLVSLDNFGPRQRDIRVRHAEQHRPGPEPRGRPVRQL
ncbi:MAG: hypothetical protein ACLTG4_05700 [Oscillospiraceae bacterium]